MEKSIETIWKEGFLENDDLVAPKINDLYTRKSVSAVDQLMKIGKLNLQVIIIAAVIILIAAEIAGLRLMGISIFLLLGWVVIYGKKKANKVREIDKSLSSYQYLKEIDIWLKDVIAGYTKMYRFLYPALFLIFTFGLWLSEVGKGMFDEIISKSPDLFLIFGVPGIWVIGVLVFAGIISLSAGAIYKFDLNLVYGRVFKKLDELLAEMEQLRS
ncbi:MAG: hypothetical protein K9J12_02695 [Melioribacteraceae bacterium]|nr:hypothetical protein [Melioribacteraceae bacterium]